MDSSSTQSLEGKGVEKEPGKKKEKESSGSPPTHLQAE